VANCRREEMNGVRIACRFLWSHFWAEKDLELPPVKENLYPAFRQEKGELFLHFLFLNWLELKIISMWKKNLGWFILVSFTSKAFFQRKICLNYNLQHVWAKNKNWWIWERWNGVGMRHESWLL
jgi:hypothetical protein